MAVDELNFDPKDIAAGLRKNVESYTPSVEREEVGRVVEAGDGIARVKGLPGAMANELLEFPGGVLGLAFNLDEDEIGCIILGESSQIEEGDLVKQTGRILSIPVGDGFLGRVIDPLGVPLDGKGPIRAEDTRVLEANAKWLLDHPGTQLLIEGHADERGTNEYNLALGENRARVTRDQLVARGVAASRITLVSYGEERPTCRESSENCWSHNRRAHFLVKTPVTVSSLKQ